MKRVLRYLRGTVDLGLVYKARWAEQTAVFEGEDEFTPLEEHYSAENWLTYTETTLMRQRTVTAMSLGRSFWQEPL